MKTWFFVAMMLGLCGVSEVMAAEPPGQPASGYGSPENYISTTYTVEESGSARLGTRVWTYIPDVLKAGDQAPVVVYLHGWTAYVPSYYLGQIEHLLNQGNIVIYPQYQKSGAWGLLTDSDQNLYLERAVDSTRQALVNLGMRADRSQVVIAGHSLGALLALCWERGEGVPASSLVMIHGSFTSDSVPDEVPIVELDYEACAAQLQTPTLWVTGDADGLWVESVDVDALLPPSTQSTVYFAISDDYGDPPVIPSHSAPLCASENDTLDYRFYFAAIDAALDGEYQPQFDLGLWSDGEAVEPVWILME